MEVKINVNEARILKLAMDGLSSREIEKQIAEEIQQSVLQEIRSRVQSKTEQLASRHFEDAYTKAITDKMKEELKKTLTPQNLAKEFKKDDWSALFENVVQPVVANFIEHALSEWLALEITVTGGKKKMSVPLCGIDSYTHRKK